MPSDTLRIIQIKEFIANWQEKGYEKGQSQPFWLDLLSKVLGVENPTQFIEFEDHVKIDKANGFIDGFIPSTKVLIEQKSKEKNLREAIKQSDGSLLNPFQQAKRYSAELPYDQRPRWIITCNFQSFLVYDMNNPNAEPEEILLKNLAKEYYRLSFIVNEKAEHLKKEEEISFKAGELIGKIYEAFSKQYVDMQNETSQKSLNELCVRLVFCLYAEDAGIFGKKDMFHDYLVKYENDLDSMRKALIELFKILDTKDQDRDPYLSDELAQFPYVNGGLFSNENIEIPKFTEEIKNLILVEGSIKFDWSDISPTIFGAVFESTLNPDTRRKGGMHYTSIENIHKVIDPLFLNDLREDLDGALAYKRDIERQSALVDFQNKLASLKFFDPACGSGNFLTETYLSLRKLENEAIRAFGGVALNPEWLIKVHINQFYGIEINDFAVTVAKTALWIAESQAMKETEEIVGTNINFLPLKSYTNIKEGNALRIDRNEVLSNQECDYIMGNPPFIGAMWSKGTQRDDISIVFPECEKTGQIDYVAGWFVKAAKFIKGTNIRCAFVSTNSLCQGQQVDLVRNPMLNLFDTKIDFAHRTFQRDSEANLKAHVHCVIVGFSGNNVKTEKFIFDGDKKTKVDNINGYLSNSANVFVSARSNQISNMPLMHMGVMARDGGNLILSEEEYQEYVKLEPQGKAFIHKYMMGREFINNINRYCFRLVDANPIEMKKCPLLLKRIEAVRQERLNSPARETQKLAETPYLFAQLAQPTQNFIAFPKVSSEKRRYIPIGFLDKDVIVGDKLYVVENVGLYHFGVLTSNVHNSRMRVVAGRMKSDYSYSNTIVYNNFPRPTPTEEQKKKIEKTAQMILDARALYPDSSLADLYDELTMPVELRKAHQENDRAVMEAYGFTTKMTESECVAELMEMYKTLVGG